MAYDATNFTVISAPAKLTPAQEILIRARDLIAKKGWGKFEFYQETLDGERHSFCILGAIGEVVSPYDHTEKLEAIRLVREQLNGPISFFNDYVFNFKEEILHLFDKTLSKD